MFCDPIYICNFIVNSLITTHTTHDEIIELLMQNLSLEQQISLQQTLNNSSDIFDLYNSATSWNQVNFQPEVRRNVILLPDEVVYHYFHPSAPLKTLNNRFN